MREALDPFVAKVGSGGDCVMIAHSATNARSTCEVLFGAVQITEH